MNFLSTAQAASEDGISVFKFSRWRNKGVTLPEVMEQYLSVKAELNVLPYCTQFIPMDIITHPKHQSIIYHPSILPTAPGRLCNQLVCVLCYHSVITIVLGENVPSQNLYEHSKVQNGGPENIKQFYIGFC